MKGQFYTLILICANACLIFIFAFILLLYNKFVNEIDIKITTSKFSIIAGYAFFIDVIIGCLIRIIHYIHPIRTIGFIYLITVIITCVAMTIALPDMYSSLAEPFRRINEALAYLKKAEASIAKKGDSILQAQEEIFKSMLALKAIEDKAQRVDSELDELRKKINARNNEQGN